MNKDIIYIDTEDDITSIIGRIKDSKDKIIALVPPKRTGVLQSAVNLRLLARTAKISNKHLVIITNNKALSALAATAKVPVAKNLQSKPEIAEIPAIQIDDDVIDGSSLPVGELAKTVAKNESIKTVDEKIVKTHDFAELDKSADKSSVEDIIDDIDLESDSDEIIVELPEDLNSTNSSDLASKIDKPKKEKKKNEHTKIPNFTKFRRKLFLAIFLFIGLVGFSVWALNYAPAAVITITARTSKAPVSVSVKLSATEATDVSKRIAQTVSKNLKKDISIEFEATGSEIRGEKATGTLTLVNSSNSDPIQVEAGSVFTNDIYEFTTDQTVIVPGAKFSGGQLSASGVISVPMTALEIGDEYNLPAGNFDSSVNEITATGSATVGGTKHTAKVVTESDIEKASIALKDLSTISTKNQLITQFINGEFVIDNSFEVIYGDPISVPKLGEELATGKAKLTSSVSHTIVALSKADVNQYLKDSIDKLLDDNKKVYDDGLASVKLSGYSKNDIVSVVNIEATGKIGPDIDTEKVKQQAVGKRFGDIQSSLSSIVGVSSVDTKFSYFWVNTVPSDLSKVTVEFKVVDNE